MFLSMYAIVYLSPNYIFCKFINEIFNFINYGNKRIILKRDL